MARSGSDRPEEPACGGEPDLVGIPERPPEPTPPVWPYPSAVMTVIDHTREGSGISVIVISHDMSVVAWRFHRILVLADGRVVESGSTAAVLGEPATPQTRALLA